MLKWKILIRRFEKPVVILAGAGVLTTILLNLGFSLLEANLYDLRMIYGSQPKADPEIVLVSLDDTTTKELDELSPLSLDYHALFLESLSALQPKAIGYLIDMNRVDQASPEIYTSAWSTRFLAAANQLEARGIPMLLGTPFDVTGEVVPPYPLSALPHSIAIIHKDGNVFSEDKVTRRALTELYDKHVFHVELAQRLGLIPQNKAVQGNFEVPEIDAKFFFFRYHGNPAASPADSKKQGYKQIPFIDVLRGAVDPALIQNKIVLVGTITRENSGDYASTPFSKSAFTNPKLVVHANVLDSVIHDDGIILAPAWVNWVITFSTITFVLWWVFTSTPLYSLFATITLAFVFMFIGQAMFSLRGLWIRESQPLVGILIAYYLAVPYRLIREYKKRWDYQRKNELLMQVEELKRNFLSLVTHDLKTPVARIQGLAEVILRRTSDKLPDSERQNLRQIIFSTDELNRFITSILELSKIESNRVQLNLESKDLNQIIERSIEMLQPQARAANITLNSELEPLFPIKVDASLISKVINNLIDNAIKYSKQDSTVTIRSHEVNQHVEISVQDQGIGLTDQELGNLFTRFYRAKNDTTTKVSGTGLGLYLTKYFIEAHHGRVEVQSQKNLGSVFKIFLPIEATAYGLRQIRSTFRKRFFEDEEEKANV
jgi:signal transduction histidine kinase